MEGFLMMEIRFDCECVDEYTLLWKREVVCDEPISEELVCWLHGNVELDVIYEQYMEYIAKGKNPLLANYY